jgi:hypothetical protein
MGASKASRLTNRAIRSRVLVFYRVEPAVLATLLPAGVRPRIRAGCGVASLCYTRLGPVQSRWLPRGFGSVTDHLAYRLCAWFDDEPGSFVVRRETSSWLGARCGEKLLRNDHRRARFAVDESAFGFNLRVVHEERAELLLRTELAGTSCSTLFGTVHDLERWLEDESIVRPHDVIMPEADAVLPGGATFAPEPLSIFELRSSFFDDLRLFPRGAAVCDSAYRLTALRSQSDASRARARPGLALEHGASPVMPSPL